MSLTWRAAWLVASSDTKDELVELARNGEALLVALRGDAPVPSARELNNSATSDAFSTWVDAYDLAAARVGGMLSSVLFAGVSGFDPRSDVIVRALVADSAPTWEQILATARGRTLASGVAAALDIDAARGRGLETGSEDQKTQSRYHRAWWSRFLNGQPVAAPGVTPALPGGTTPVRPTTPAGGGGSSGDVLVLAMVLGALALLKRKKR